MEHLSYAATFDYDLLLVPFATNMATFVVEKDKGVHRNTCVGASLDDVVGAIKHLSETMENMDKHNRRRPDAIENTNYTMLKAICNFVKQDQTESTKDGMDDVKMSATQNTSLNDETLHCLNPKKPLSTPTLRSMKKEAYAKSKANLTNIETIFIPADDDDEFSKPLPLGIKGKFLGQENKTTYSSPKTINISGLHDVNTTDDSSPQEPFMNNYVTGLTAKGKNNKETLMAPRKLTFPQESCRTSKKPKIDQLSQTSNAQKIQYSKGSSFGKMDTKKASRIFHRPRTNTTRGYTHTIPKDMPCCFKPNVDMNLIFEETQVCAYVFNPNVDPSGNKILYRVGNNLGTQQNFQSLCPNKPVREEVAYSQLYRTRSVWCMPPAFAVDGIHGTPMPPFSNLNLIYIPIVQNSDHWYLMVIDMHEKKHFHLDCDLTSETAYDRKDTIKIMTNVMLSVLEIVFATQDLVIGFHQMDCWDIVEARGIPNCGSSEKSALWVLEWMQMEESFVSLLYGVIEEKAVRIKVAMILLLGTHNQCKGDLIRNAKRTWHDYIHAKH
ncbi:hypothetical protein HKD37_03G007589 [Glycine soja]